jgi:sigma-B regulation protein RsbU (phosphoserine phosphatase)
MSFDLDVVMRDQLALRRQRISSAISSSGPDPQLTSLLQKVDEALERFESGSYGLCDVCHEPVEAARLIANPLERFCLDHLNPRERSALEDDLNLASQIQRGLLPPETVRLNGWHFEYGYEPAGAVSGDYVDVIPTPRTDVYFALGDVSGKGVAASMLMAKLHAVFRSLVPLGLTVDQLVERADRLLADGVLPGQYATLICGVASETGEVAMCNAGHPPALVSRSGHLQPIPATGLPLGLFPGQKFSVEKVRLQTDDRLLLYTDGVTDAVNSRNEDYGMSRLIECASRSQSLPADAFLSSCLSDVSVFRQRAARSDDITMLAIRRLV